MGKREIFHVSDMTCRRCEKALEGGLSKAKGIINVKADYASGKLTVEYDDAVCSRAEIQKIVERTGYHLASKPWKTSALETLGAALVVFAAFCIIRMTGLLEIFAFFLKLQKLWGIQLFSL